LLTVANGGGWRLRRILRFRRAAFCATLGRPVEVVVGNLQVVLLCDRGGVANPGADDVQGIFGRTAVN
jgi:hypothetical protein